MRILYHHRTLGDGAEGIHATAMIDAFRALGHHVDVRGLAASSDGHGRRAAARVRSLLPGAAFEMASAAVNLVEYIDTRRALRRARPAFVYKRHARYDVGVARAARRAGVPLVLEVNSLFSQGAYHGFEPLRLRPVAAAMERWALRHAQVVLAVSTPLARQIESFAQRPVAVLPNGADPVRFDPDRINREHVRERYRLRPELLTVGWVGIIREWHGLELLVDMLATLPDTQLLLVGDGPAAEDVRARASRLGVADRLVITGRVPFEEMPDHIGIFDVAVVADERTGVASPMKLLEYMAMRCAVVAPRLQNIADLVADGENGLLFTPGSAPDLSAAVRRASDQALRETLGRNARASIEQARNWRHNAERVLALLESATIDDRSGRS